jgi:metal-dependent HD superfamily phosphatase/phosphodiesterase
MNNILTFEEIKSNREIEVYFEYMNKAFALMGHKEHDKNHALYAAEIAERVLKGLGYSEREQELAKIAAYIHDIGNIISKHGHDQSSAIMFLNLIEDDKYGEDIFKIASAVGSHEDKSIGPGSPIAAALVIGDKTDVAHERLDGEDLYDLDKHYLVVAACQKVDVVVNKDKEELVIELHIEIDNAICSVMNYFEIFMSRINYCRRASSILKCNFELYINEDKFL